MKLHDQMDAATASTTADLDRLFRDSRRQGSALRRRRQSLSAVGAAAAVAMVAGAGYLAIDTSDPGTGQVADLAADPTMSPSASAEPGPSRVPLSGRSTAAALEAAIDELADGEFGGFAGQGGPGDPGSPSPDTYAELEFTPSDGTGLGVVGVNVQDGSILEDDPFTCGQSFMVDCAVRTLPDGDRIRTYQDQPVTTSEGDGIRVVAELLTRDRSLRVVASATNGFDLPSNQWDVTRPAPVLTTAQLSEIVAQPWWGFQIPAEYDEAGRALSPYEDLDANVGGGSSVTPAPK